MSDSTDLHKTIKKYIISCIDNSGYSDIELTSDKEKVNFLHETFKAEFQWRIDQLGQQKALTEWFSGLPSSCNIVFYNNDVLDLAVKWGQLDEKASDNQNFKILNNWFNLLAAKTSQLFREYK